MLLQRPVGMKSKLLQKVNPLCRGIIWITKEELSTDLEYFNDLDYLANGLIRNFLQKETEQKKQNA